MVHTENGKIIMHLHHFLVMENSFIFLKCVSEIIE
ncbi:GSCOCG00000917001-RA-CDS [Cotesia congregata]|nr:GSCOCG00000917001-RA-CDS [Cotesia congregata]